MHSLYIGCGASRQDYHRHRDTARYNPAIFFILLSDSRYKKIRYRPLGQADIHCIFHSAVITLCLICFYAPNYCFING